MVQKARTSLGPVPRVLEGVELNMHNGQQLTGKKAKNGAGNEMAEEINQLVHRSNEGVDRLGRRIEEHARSRCTLPAPSRTRIDEHTNLRRLCFLQCTPS